MGAPRIAEITVRRLPLADAKPHPRNPREHPDPGSEGWEKLKRSLADAYFDPLIWNQRNGLLVSGHLRRKVLLDLGFTAADVVVVDWPEPIHLARMIAANQLAGKNDRHSLATIVEELQLGAVDLALTGLPDDALAKLLPASDRPLPPDVEVGGDLANPAITRAGDCYQLGGHRLMCGDCRHPVAVHELLAGDVVDQVVTDPPYGIDYVAKSRAVAAALGRPPDQAAHAHIVNDDLADYRRFFGAFLAPVPFAPKNTVYVFMSGQELHNLRLAFDDQGLTWGDYLIWVKNGQVIGRKDYHPQHEFIVYGWKGAHRFHGGISSAVIDDEIPATKLSKGALVAEVDRLRAFRRTVLREDKPLVNDLHPTMKPVNLVRRLLLDGSGTGGLIYDPFLGSGTTLLACDLVDRRCRGLELDGRHCDTTVRRWLALGGDRRVHRVSRGAPEDVTDLFRP
jgi:DNA modification methylase